MKYSIGDWVILSWLSRKGVIVRKIKVNDYDYEINLLDGTSIVTDLFSRYIPTDKDIERWTIINLLQD